MLFTRVSAVLPAVILGFAAMTVNAVPASQTDTGSTDPTGSCSSGTMSCCNLQQVNGPSDISNIIDSILDDVPIVGPILGGLLGGLLGPILDGVLGALPLGSIVGLGCTDILGSGCSQQTACCTGDSFDGLINLGCINLNL